jgi:hypothetical protein
MERHPWFIARWSGIKTLQRGQLMKNRKAALLVIVSL